MRGARTRISSPRTGIGSSGTGIDASSKVSWNREPSKNSFYFTSLYAERK
ncbi:hypothetical protein KHA96_19975 [Bacillus sp. FJAT-49711]|nr:hypothetical protein [Bacillus sp. FJAT-49711]MBS4220581.1 hypothetical protein [Bacillus sp. FJAT-49711]